MYKKNSQLTSCLVLCIILSCFTISVPTSQCGENERYYDDCAPSCGGTCETYGPGIYNCPLCRAGCWCTEGLVMRNDGRCVPPEECPKTTGVSLDDFGIESKRSIRTKRGLLCLLVTPVFKEIFYVALKEVQTNDPMDIGDAVNGKLEDGVFNGLSTLKATTLLKVSCESETVSLSSSLELKNISICYDWSRRLLSRLGGQIWMTVRKMEFDLDMTLAVSDGVQLNVTNIEVTKLKGFRLGFSGLGLANIFVKLFGDVMFHVFKKKITAELEEIIQNILQSKLSSMSEGLSF